MSRIWKWYKSCLSLHPVKTQVVSSGFLWGIGDVGAQYITHFTTNTRLRYKVSTFFCILSWSLLLVGLLLSGPLALYLACVKQDSEQEFITDWKRVAITSMFGFGFVGPAGHYWYEGLDRFIKLRLQLRPKSVKFVAAKVAMDGLIFGPFDLFVFFSYMGLSTGKSVPEVKADVKRDFIPALILEGGIWPIVQIANFRYVPVRYQLLYVNIFCLLDSAFLSWIEQQKDAPWKRRFTSFISMR
ncbi:protein SYM1 [Gossypium australe]|uniref:Protein SYM1 n=1 Tax=Gossypium australe TaxID=47621 RepID=A0A5B6X917_9ROSI|nr:protein SYM1 [Gossypium australe]